MFLLSHNLFVFDESMQSNEKIMRIDRDIHDDAEPWRKGAKKGRTIFDTAYASGAFKLRTEGSWLPVPNSQVLSGPSLEQQLETSQFTQTSISLY